MKVNLGAGRRPMDGWVNVDCVPLPGIDVVANLDDPDKVELPWDDDSVDEFAIIHTLEHIAHPLPLMQELWRAAKPAAKITIACPYGSSDDAWEDPTHVRAMFLRSFDYFGQPFYHRAQYNTTRAVDVFGQPVHPSVLCPWHVQSALQANHGPGMDRADSSKESEWGRPLLEGWIHQRFGSTGAWRHDPRAQVRNGDRDRTSAVSLGVSASQERGGGRQSDRQPRTMGQTSTVGAALVGSPGLDYGELSDGMCCPIALPPLGKAGCTCTWADYGYRGDWTIDKLILDLPRMYDGTPNDEIMRDVMVLRNVVTQITAKMHAVKPMREPRQDLIMPPTVQFRLI